VSQELTDAEWLRDRIDRWSIGLHSKITVEDRERALSIAAKLERPAVDESPGVVHWDSMYRIWEVRCENGMAYNEPKEDGDRHGWKDGMAVVAKVTIHPA
jgi:hypothetical protein